MAYFDCQIVQGGGGIILTVECNQVFAGAAITATDGVTTLSQTCPSSSPYEVQFNIPNVGTWTISGTYAGDSYSTQVVIPSSATLSPIPNGSTATPTDVIQTWLKCADIFDKNYTTISQVLADSATFLALISSNNAVDYMARSTTWASSVCANSSAMTKIGANNYCADTLLVNSTWRTAICNSTYMESVLNVKVPTMTSNTTPSGVAKASSKYANNYDAYCAFDGNAATNGWIPSNGTSNQWISYQFSNSFKPLVMIAYTSRGGTFTNNTLQGGNNDANFIDLASIQSITTTSTKVILENNNTYDTLKLLCSSITYSGNYGLKLQFYGR